ncbi:MAG: hypothetical protein LBT26_02705, partial [Clostridiales Family XIII bacterium]|nr:hypothetical protein [Clostridiales Family XIII bacterium]
MTKAEYTRGQMTAKAVASVYYSGWATETVPMTGRADLAVTLATLLADAGLTFASGDTLRLTSIDNAVTDFTYDELMGVPRYYYPAIMSDSDAGKTEILPFFVVKGNASETGEPGAGDALNTYRFIFGQSEDDYANHTKSGDKQPKWVTDVTVVKAAGGTGAPGSGDIDGDGTVTITD